MLDRRLSVVIAVVAVIAAISVAFLALKGRTATTVQQKSGVKEYLKQAEISLNEGNLLKARQAYAQVINEHPDSLFVELAQKELERLNMRILFSPIETENSIIYTVQEGDTLRKIAKKHNTTVEMLMRSNGLETDLIHPGKRLKIATSRFTIVADKSQNLLTLKADGEVLKVYRVSTGIDGITPVGRFTVVNKLTDPTWYKAGAIVPSGSSENILGSRWMGLDITGYGIHGTTEPDTIGKHITAGCIRMRNEEVEELYAIVPVGAEVKIVD